MCGIVGVAGVQAAGPASAEILEDMVRRVRHRGPDATGRLVLNGIALGHTRLAIIDLDPRSAQPQVSPDGRFSVVFNGEIYNYKELRRELSGTWQFTTQSDTEVLLAAWSAWGAEAVRRFRGMFAFAVWDAHKKSLYLVRDRFGIKPLYTTTVGGLLYFASEITPLFAAGVGREPDLAVVGRFLDYGLVEASDDQTFFARIRQVPAAHIVRVCAGAVSRRRYWAPGESSDSTNEAEFNEALHDSIRLHLRADVPIGTALSGGLDSSTIASMIQHVRRGEGHQLLVTAGSQDPATDESSYAALVAQRLGLPIHRVVPTGDGLLDDLGDLVRCQEQPMATSGVYAQYCVMREAAASGIKVMQDGQGADEVLGGYGHHRMARLRELIRHHRMREAATLIGGKGAPGGANATIIAAALGGSRYRYTLANVHARDSVRSLAGEQVREAMAAAPEALPAHLDSLLHSRLEDVASATLPGLLRYEDRNSMAFSLEARVPFLDHVVVERALALSGSELFMNGFSKYPLRTYLAEHVGPDIAWRRNKLGYATPQDEWISGPLHAFANDVFRDARIEASGLIDTNRALAALRRASRHGSSLRSWRALSVALWFAWVVQAPEADSHHGSPRMSRMPDSRSRG